MLHSSSAYDHVDDPADPAWIGHALAEPRPAWWRRRAAVLAAGATAVVACGAVVALLVFGGGSGGADADDGAGRGATGSGGGTRAAGAVEGEPAADMRSDVIDPVIEPIDPDTSKFVDPARALPNVSSGAGGVGGVTRVRDDAPLTGPTGDVGLTARVEHSDLPTLYIDDGSSAAGASFDGWGATAHLAGDLQGLDELLRIRLDQLGAAMGVRLEVISGFRTHEEQQALYAEYLSGTGNLAAVPGSSRHETGRAADVYVDGVALANVPGARAAATRLGIGFPVPGEAWHTELVAAD